jgi:hypothetical protein
MFNVKLTFWFATLGVSNLGLQLGLNYRRLEGGVKQDSDCK